MRMMLRFTLPVEKGNQVSQIVEIVEPLFSHLNAAVEIVPVMTGDDLRKGIAKTTSK
jgi:hypothetical protein